MFAIIIVLLVYRLQHHEMTLMWCSCIRGTGKEGEGRGRGHPVLHNVVWYHCVIDKSG
jgi:hypothetical protein